MRDGGAHCPRDCEGIQTRPGRARSAWEGDLDCPPPPKYPKCLTRPRCHGNGPRCVRIMQRGGDVRPPPRPGGPLPQARVQDKKCATVRSRGPVMGCIACCSKPTRIRPQGGGNTTSSRLLEGRCNGCWCRVGQIGEASRHERCPGAPVSGGDGCAPDRGSPASGEVLGTGARGRSVCTGLGSCCPRRENRHAYIILPWCQSVVPLSL